MFSSKLIVSLFLATTFVSFNAMAMNQGNNTNKVMKSTWGERAATCTAFIAGGLATDKILSSSSLLPVLPRLAISLLGGSISALSAKGSWSRTIASYVVNMGAALMLGANCSGKTAQDATIIATTSSLIAAALVSLNWSR